MSCSKCSKCGEIGRPWCQWTCEKLVEPVKESKTSTKVMVEDDVEECPICYNELGATNFCVTKCGHKFCMDCVTQHLANSIACPMCRTDIVEKVVRAPAAPVVPNQGSILCIFQMIRAITDDDSGYGVDEILYSLRGYEEQRRDNLFNRAW